MDCGDSYCENVEREQEPIRGTRPSDLQRQHHVPKLITYPKYTAAAVGQCSAFQEQNSISDQPAVTIMFNHALSLMRTLCEPPSAVPRRVPLHVNPRTNPSKTIAAARAPIMPVEAWSAPLLVSSSLVLTTVARSQLTPNTCGSRLLDSQVGHIRGLDVTDSVRRRDLVEEGRRSNETILHGANVNISHDPERCGPPVLLTIDMIGLISPRASVKPNRYMLLWNSAYIRKAVNTTGNPLSGRPDKFYLGGAYR